VDFTTHHVYCCQHTLLSYINLFIVLMGTFSAAILSVCCVTLGYSRITKKVVIAIVHANIQAQPLLLLLPTLPCSPCRAMLPTLLRQSSW
jgi:hypothetical protein